MKNNEISELEREKEEILEKIRITQIMSIETIPFIIKLKNILNEIKRNN